MKQQTSAITVIPATDGFLDDLVPDAGSLIEDQLENSGGLGSQHSRRAYLEDSALQRMARQPRDYQVADGRIPASSVQLKDIPGLHLPQLGRDPLVYPQHH